VQRCMERSDVAVVIAVLPRSHAGDPPPWIFQCDVDRLLVSAGGRERGDSVYAGLTDLPPEVRIVVIHDAARPLMDAETLDRVIAVARTGSGAVAGVPMTDTLKRVNDADRVVETVDRAHLWRAQTPQAFPRDMIERAYADALAHGIRATDDAALCERLGMPVAIVRGSERAIKITEEADFARVEALALAPQ